MEENKYFLTSKDFACSASNTFKHLLTDKEFADVTLACDGNEQISAHKVILSSSSKLFHNILLKNPHQHPLIYLNGMNYADIQSIIDFMYLGQTQVEQTHLEQFLLSAKKLQVNGLMEDSTDSLTRSATLGIDEEDIEVQKERSEIFTEKEHQIKIDPDVVEGTLDGYGDVERIDIDGSCSSQNGTFDQFEIVEHSLVEVEKHKKFSCNYCDKAFSQSGTLNRHVKTLHMRVKGDMQNSNSNQIETDVIHFEDSHFTAVTENPVLDNLYMGQIMEEEAEPTKTFKCYHCEKSFSQSGTLNRHIKSVHEGIRYQCDYCDYAGTTTTCLKRHLANRHPDHGLE